MKFILIVNISNKKLVASKASPDLEILLEVNLNFQVRLTIILANGIFFLVEFTWKFAVDI